MLFYKEIDKYYNNILGNANDINISLYNFLKYNIKTIYFKLYIISYMNGIYIRYYF
jgi:hypothetical protein